MCPKGSGSCCGSCLAGAVGCGFYRGASLCMEDPCSQPFPSFPCTVADCRHGPCRRAVRLSCDFPWTWGIDLWLCPVERKVCSAQCIAWGACSCAPALERCHIWAPPSGHAAVTVLLWQPDSWHEDLGVPWWFVPGIWVAVAVSHLHKGPERCPLPAGSPPDLPGLLCPAGPVRLLDLPALMLSEAVSRLRDGHPVAVGHR